MTDEHISLEALPAPTHRDELPRDERGTVLGPWHVTHYPESAGEALRRMALDEGGVRARGAVRGRYAPGGLLYGDEADRAAALGCTLAEGTAPDDFEPQCTNGPQPFAPADPKDIEAVRSTIADVFGHGTAAPQASQAPAAPTLATGEQSEWTDLAAPSEQPEGTPSEE